LESFKNNISGYGWGYPFRDKLKVPGCPENLSKIYSIILKWQLFV
jgi:hypothetical protein